MTVLMAVLLVALIVFWFCFGGEWRETGAREPRPISKARPGSIENPLVVVRTSPDPLILPPGVTLHMWDWRSEQIAPGVSRCPNDPENESSSNE